MFANPYMLVGLSLAVLPVVIHLLSRARYRTVDWGAMMFLEGADASQAASRRFGQALLLLIRGGIVALLAVALARPEVEGQFASPGPARRGPVALVLDCSASMGYDENGHARFDLAKEAAKQLLSLHRGDRVSLVLAGRGQPPADRAPTADLWDVGRRIESAELGPARADVARALDDALEAVEPPPTTDAATGDTAASGVAGPARGERRFVTVYVVTDRQAGNWREVLDAGGEWAAGWRQRLARANLVARVVCVPIGAPEGGNLVVRSVDVAGGGPVIAGQPVEVEVRVQNHGPVQWAAVPLTVRVGLRVVSEQRVNLAPDAAATFRVPVSAGFPDAGAQVVSAELNRPSGPPAANPPASRTGGGGGGGLASDDRLETVVDVREPIRVLVVTPDAPAADDDRDAGTVRNAGTGNGDDAAPDGPTTADYLSAALAPFKAAKKKAADPCVVELARPDRWAGDTVRLASAKPKQDAARLDDFGVVVLAGLERLTDEQAAAVEEFVAGGGGVLVAPGELSRPDLYNTLYEGGTGLLPAALADPTSADWSDQTSLLDFDPTHPVLRFLGGRADVLAPATVGRYFPAEPVASQARVLMRYATGEPFLIESAAGPGRRGRVLLVTTSLGADWSTLPLTSFYLPFVQSAAAYLGEGPPRRLNLAPGELIELPVDEMADVRIKPPDAPDERRPELARSAGHVLARYAETDAPGLYQVRVTDPGGKRTIVQFSVTPPRDESDLTPLAAADWRRLEQLAGVQRLDPAVTPLTAATVLPAPRELWPWALGAVFVLGVLEMKLSRMWSRTEPTED